MKGRYKNMSFLYDFMGMLYSAGRIGMAKTGMHDHIRPDDRILFAGVGKGSDAVEAAERGGQVTVIDISSAMLDRFLKRIAGRDFLHPIEIIHEDIFSLEDYEKFDLVYANFFLSVFPRVMVQPLLEHLARLTKKNGYIVISDFAFPAGGPFRRFIQVAYWYIADVFLHITAENAIHALYDYREMLKGQGLSIVEIRYFRVLFDDRLYAILARKG